MVLCTSCGKRKAVIVVKSRGEALCKECFLRKFKDLVIKALTDARLTGGLGSKLVAVATSGGKDSSNALYVLNELKQTYGFDLIAIMVNEGIKGYRELKAKALRKLCKKLNVELIEVNLRKEVGVDIDEVASLYERGLIPFKPCTVCGVLRRYLVSLYAKELGANYVATGHNLDDEIQTFVMNLIRGDLRAIAREGIITSPGPEDVIPRFKPLYYITERESMAYFILRGLMTPHVECPYAKLSMRYKIRSLINYAEYRYPGSKYRLLKLKEEIKAKVEMPRTALRKCTICGMPSSRHICRACEMKEEISKALRELKLSKF